jgi:periplasmic copper chaperone A
VKRSALLLAMIELASTAAAQPATLRVTEAWARPCRVGTTCGVYVTLENQGRVALEIVGAVSPSAAVVELHQTKVHNGQAHMMAHATALIAAGSRLEGKPGNWHVMLKQVRRPLSVGDTVSLSFTIREAKGPSGSMTLLVRAPVRVP